MKNSPEITSLFKKNILRNIVPPRNIVHPIKGMLIKNKYAPFVVSTMLKNSTNKKQMPVIKPIIHPLFFSTAII
jgi:hypothetical protein